MITTSTPARSPVARTATLSTPHAWPHTPGNASADADSNTYAATADSPLACLVGVRSAHQCTETGSSEIDGCAAQSNSNSRSGPDRDTAARSCSPVTGRATIAPTDNTGKPSPSASSIDTDDAPSAKSGPDADAPRHASTPLPRKRHQYPPSISSAPPPPAGRATRHPTARMHSEPAGDTSASPATPPRQNLVAAAPHGGQSLKGRP
ncbi:hypothetical protein I553_4043 [Mycobacterium xenopi 4042]|uniref:Uncharacterized protein n=1 Tax=Mycobacterium xenopi 4042 TaxID=1299334 RepID=X7YNX0_MYCXE|nr:hypothetical protein I553_4043 [Mycobacterium xenopi 4042]